MTISLDTYALIVTVFSSAFVVHTVLFFYSMIVPNKWW